MSEQAARSYSSMPKAARRTWVVPRWLKEAFVAFAVVALAVVAASKLVQHFGGKASRAASAMDADELPSSSAPTFTLPMRDGKQVDLSAYRGKVVLLNFWATWCPPCRAEEPSLRQLAKVMDPKKFQLLAISVDEGGPRTVGLHLEPRTDLSLTTRELTLVLDAARWRTSAARRHRIR